MPRGLADPAAARQEGGDVNRNRMSQLRPVIKTKK
jgi:hypothetical protein